MKTLLEKIKKAFHQAVSDLEAAEKERMNQEMDRNFLKIQKMIEKRQRHEKG